MLYAKTQNDPRVQHLFAAAAAAGLLVAMAVKVLKPLRHARAAAGIAVLAFVAIAVLRIPLLTTMLVLTPVSVWFASRRRGHAPARPRRATRSEEAGMNDTLIAIATIFSQLSLLAFGGGNTILPEMQRQVVDVHHWMSAHEFTALFALAGRARAEHDDRVAGGLARGRLERVASLASSGRRRSSPCSRCMRGSAFATGCAACSRG